MNTGLQILESITILSVVKWLVVVLLLVYVVFSFLMMRMIASMTRAVTIRDEYIIKILGSAHFAIAVVVLILAIFVL